MAKEGIYNLASAGIDEIIEAVSDSIAMEFKGVRPFDQEPVSPKEALVEFDEMTPEQIQRMREEFGDEPVDLYLDNMTKLGRRYK